MANSYNKRYHLCIVSLRHTISTSIEKFIRYICTVPSVQVYKVTNTHIIYTRAHYELDRINHIISS